MLFERKKAFKRINERINDFSEKTNRIVPPINELGDEILSPEEAYNVINDELRLEADPLLNLATFVTTTMDHEAEELMMESFNKNFINKPEYPQTIEIMERCVSILSNLFNSESDGTGTATVGSSEAIHLCGLTMKWNWKAWFEKKYNKKPERMPRIIMGSNVQVCWEKFCRYFDVELVEIDLDQENRIPPAGIEAAIDEYTIGVVGILGNTYSGEFDDIAAIDTMIERVNAERGFDIPIHVDGASGAFVANFTDAHEDIIWDFRLKNVVTINASGHKYGLVYPGVGWAMWRSKKYIPKDLVFEINYLGETQEDFGINFSRGSSQIIGQYYNFVKLGKSGYSQIMNDLMLMHDMVKETLLDIHLADGRKLFYSQSHAKGLPLVAISLNTDIKKFTLRDLSEVLKKHGWILPSYRMSAPKEDTLVMRMVIRLDFTPEMLRALIKDIENSLVDLLSRDEVLIKEQAKFKKNSKTARSIC